MINLLLFLLMLSMLMVMFMMAKGRIERQGLTLDMEGNGLRCFAAVLRTTTGTSCGGPPSVSAAAGHVHHTHSLTHLLTHSFTHSLTHSLTHRAQVGMFVFRRNDVFLGCSNLTEENNNRNAVRAVCCVTGRRGAFGSVKPSRPKESIE